MKTHKILIVDDDADMILATRVVLESAGYSVAEAANGELGLAAMRADKPDLVLMDVMMSSPLDGIRLLTPAAVNGNARAALAAW